MNKANLSVREIRMSDIPLIANYWTKSNKSHLLNMGVDLTKIPPAEKIASNLSAQLEIPLELRQSYCIIWLLNGEPVGHSNTNPTYYGNEAYMHLHLWEINLRMKGIGTYFLQLTLPYYFENLKLNNLYCQPYSLNPAPNKTIEKAGFTFVKEYITTPGSLNYEQPVKLWQMSYAQYCKLYNKIDSLT